MIDRVLSERLESARAGRLDILVFFAAFVGGLALYFLLRLLGQEQRVVTIAIVLVMLIYAAVVAKVPRLRIRLDRAERLGDGVLLEYAVIR